MLDQSETPEDDPELSENLFFDGVMLMQKMLNISNGDLISRLMACVSALIMEARPEKRDAIVGMLVKQLPEIVADCVAQEQAADQ